MTIGSDKMTHAICYKNTFTNIPNFEGDTHLTQQNGYAYETNAHFIHIYGYGNGLHTISPGLTVCEGKNGTLENWVKRVFGATNIQQMNNEVGHSIKAIWRPGLYYENEIFEALCCDEYECRSSEQALVILLQKLSDLLLYIEPDINNLDTYSHKTRELLILACTEVENQWLSILKKSNALPLSGRYSTNDYVKLNNLAYLFEYQVSYNNYRNISSIQPFKDWNSLNPTQSLDWYNAYNKTKHDSDVAFKDGKLKYVLNAISDNIILHCVRFSPYGLYNRRTTLSGFINQMVDISLVNCNIKTFYIPFIELPNNSRNDLFVYDSYRMKHNKSWISSNISLDD